MIVEGWTAQLGICNVRIWWSQVLKQVLNAADSDSDKTKAKRSVNCRGQSIAEVSQLQKPREQEENRNSSKVESTYWGVSQARYCSLGSTKLASHNF